MPSFVTLLRAPNPGPMTLDGTNTWVLRGEPGAPALVVDPGPADDGHLAAIAAAGPVGALLLTHRHLDHTEGVDRLRALIGRDVPVYAADPALARGTDPLRDRDELRVAGLEIETLAAPGHTSDSVCLVVSDGTDRAVFTGDTILGRGTAVIAWPDGDLGDYLTTLDRLGGYAEIPAYPGHGPIRADCGAIAREYRAHRDDRIGQVRAALAAGARTPADVVAHVYPDLEPALIPAAEWTVRAALAYLDPTYLDPTHADPP